MPFEMIPTTEATAMLPTGAKTKPITVIGTAAIRETFDETCLQQAVNSRLAPGVTDLILNPDAHCGYGAPVGCVMVSPTHIYPGPVGVDIKCSMSLLQLNLPADAILDRPVRRALIQAICERTPTGAGRGQRHAKKSRRIDADLGRRVVVEGASASVCEAIGIPPEWAGHCEDASHVGHDDTRDALELRLQRHRDLGFFRNFEDNATRKTGAISNLLFSSFGPETLRELRQSWAQIDEGVHVNQFIDMLDLGGALQRSGFSEPVLDVDRHVLRYADAPALMRELKAIGAHNVNAGRQRTLTGRHRFGRMVAAYETLRTPTGLPATYEVVYAAAWGAGASAARASIAPETAMSLDSFTAALRRPRP